MGSTMGSTWPSWHRWRPLYRPRITLEQFSYMAPIANSAPHASNCVATIMSPCKPSFHDAASNAILLPHSHHKCSPYDAGIIVSL